MAILPRRSTARLAGILQRWNPSRAFTLWANARPDFLLRGGATYAGNQGHTAHVCGGKIS